MVLLPALRLWLSFFQGHLLPFPCCACAFPKTSDLAILRTTPALLGLFSLITVWADGLARDTTTALRPNAAAWYRKQEPTFSDAIAAVRRVLWCPPNFSVSRPIGDIIEIPTSLLNRVFQTLCLAA